MGPIPALSLNIVENSQAHARGGGNLCCKQACERFTRCSCVPRNRIAGARRDGNHESGNLREGEHNRAGPVAGDASRDDDLFLLSSRQLHRQEIYSGFGSEFMHSFNIGMV